MTHRDGPQPYGSGDQPGSPGGPEAAPVNPPYGQAGYGQTPYQPTWYGQPLDAQPPYGQAPYGSPPGAYQQPYGPPPGSAHAAPQRTNGLAIASMVLGILWIYWIGSILALIFGYIARKQIRQRGESGAGMAMAGIVLGWVGIGVLVLVAVAGVAAYSG